MTAENENEPKSTPQDPGRPPDQVGDETSTAVAEAASVETAEVEPGSAPPEASADASEDASITSADAEDATVGDEPEAENGDNGKAEQGVDGPTRDAERITALFTRSEASVEALGGGAFRFARWSRPIAPAFFGLSEESVSVMQNGFREAAELAGVAVAAEDDDLGANILVYAVEDWRALRDAP